MHSVDGGRQKECKLRRGRVAFLPVNPPKWDFTVAEECEVTVAALFDPGEECKPPGPGLLSRDLLGWTMMRHTPRSGGLAFPECSAGGSRFFLRLFLLWTGQSGALTAQHGR